MPTYVVSQSPGKVVLRNFEGVITTYTEPTDYKNECNCKDCQENAKVEGVASLLRGQRLAIEPEVLMRKLRAHNK